MHHELQKMEMIKIIVGFIAVVAAIGVIGDWAAPYFKKRKDAKTDKRIFEDRREGASDKIGNIHHQFKRLDDLHDFDRNAFRGEEGQEIVELIREMLDDFRSNIDGMSDFARTHEQFRMVSDVTYVHSALRSAMTHYSRTQ